MRIIDKNKDKTLKTIRIINNNYKERNYKTTKLTLKDTRIMSKFNVIREIRDKNCKIQIVARSAYPGWQCFVREVTAKIQFFSIDLGK